MDYLINWSMNAIDTVFSTGKAGAEDPSCPGGCFASGYVRDSYKKWQPICLNLLSVEDSEDLYIFGLLIILALVFGTGGALMYRKICLTGSKTGAPRLPVMIIELGKALAEQNRLVMGRLDNVNAKLDIAMRPTGAPRV